MLQFVARQNVERRRSRLQTETGRTIRTFLLKLLAEEEDKLGRDYELLADVEREIINGHARIARQEVIVRDLEGNGGDGAGAKALLQTFTLTQQAYADYRHKILKAIDGGEL
jgi:hypothetical protein